MNHHQEQTMKCPTCPDSALVMSDRQGVEIDYCPQCRGVWLDRGELDKLIERSVSSAPAPRAPAAAPSRPDFVDSDYGRSPGYPGGRRKSWLSDIFD
jgi:Zn-finger nucleic acid-binding protein